MLIEANSWRKNANVTTTIVKQVHEYEFQTIDGSKCRYMSALGLGFRSVVLLAPSSFGVRRKHCRVHVQPPIPARLRGVEDSGTAIALLAGWGRHHVQHHWHRPQRLRELGTPSAARYEPKLYWMGPSTTLSVPVLLTRIYLFISTPCNSPASVWRWTIPPCASQLDCVSVLRLSAHMFVSVARQSQSMDTTVCLVALALVAIHGRTGQRSVVSFLHQHRHTGNSWAAFFMHERQQAAGWYNTTHRREVGASSGMLPVWGDIRSVLHVQASSIQAGPAATTEEKKTVKYSDIVSGVDFSKFAIENSGVWRKHALDLVTEINRRIEAVTHDPRSTMFLRQRLSVAVQCGVSWEHSRTMLTNINCLKYNVFCLLFLWTVFRIFFGWERTVLYWSQ